MSQYEQLPYFDIGNNISAENGDLSSDGGEGESLISSFNDDSEQSNDFKEINENLGIVRDVIRSLVPLGTVKVAEGIIIEPVIEYVFESCKHNPNMVFVTLYYAREI